MKKRPLFFSAVLTVLAGMSLARGAQAVVIIDWVTVGNAGNAPDTRVMNDGTSGYGAVDYEYRIARNPVTIAQYTGFLNAVAASDPYGLYNTNMAADDWIAGISRSGSPGGYTYNVVGSGARPITYVSWFDAARFVNWLHNGQGGGGTETGVYNLGGAMSGTGFSVQPGAALWIPTEDEWYKAAYYDPAKNGGAGGYWLHANRSDSMTNNAIGEVGAANFYNGNFPVFENGLPSRLTDVGAYGVASQSAYGTNDQAGNVWEWNDTVFYDYGRGLRGGAWNSMEFELRSSHHYHNSAALENYLVGFRLAAIPEPDCVVPALLFATLGCLRRRR